MFVWQDVNGTVGCWAPRTPLCSLSALPSRTLRLLFLPLGLLFGPFGVISVPRVGPPIFSFRLALGDHVQTPGVPYHRALQGCLIQT